MVVDDDWVFNPMIYDAMRELAARIGGRCAIEAKRVESHQLWVSLPVDAPKFEG